MLGKRILVIEDETDILEVVRYNLAREGYKVRCARNGLDGLRVAQTELPDLIMLDLMLPEMDGLDICRSLKADRKTEDIPIIMLTAKTEETDIVLGLELGADDYITKPFSPRVLIARIKAVLRRKEKTDTSEDKAVSIHGLTIDPVRHEVLVEGSPVRLTFNEFKILHLLASQPGRVFTRYQIVDAVHGEEYSVTERAVDVQIAGLRKKLGTAGKYVETVRGVGYRLRD
ncbi:MAG: response regulator transcription factor [Deltaproteobacteria bacterium]|nr:response regulator transcription factor [Deltaproteobacteria bacterium]